MAIKPIWKVFMVIGALLIAALIWVFFFNGDGVLKTGTNAVIRPINSGWSAITGDSASKLIPEFDTQGSTLKEGQDQVGGGGF